MALSLGLLGGKHVSELFLIKALHPRQALLSGLDENRTLTNLQLDDAGVSEELAEALVNWSVIGVAGEEQTEKPSLAVYWLGTCSSTGHDRKAKDQQRTGILEQRGSTHEMRDQTQSQPTALSATPATQNEGGCRQVPRLPVDVAKCHACHAKCRGVTGDQNGPKRATRASPAPEVPRLPRGVPSAPLGKCQVPWCVKDGCQRRV